MYSDILVPLLFIPRGALLIEMMNLDVWLYVWCIRLYMSSGHKKSGPYLEMSLYKKFHRHKKRRTIWLSY